MKKIYIFSLVIISTFFIAGYPLGRVLAAAQIPNFIPSVTSPCDLLTKIADGIGAIVASLGVIMLIFSGILYLTSAGSPERMNKAKTALIYAIVGIMIGIAASTIVDVVKTIITASGSTC